MCRPFFSLILYVFVSFGSLLISGAIPGKVPGIIQKAFAEDFPVDDYMRVRVNFWKKVYTEITSREAYVHDSDDLSLIYKKIELNKNSRKSNRRVAKKEKRAIRSLLKSIATKKKQEAPEENYSNEEKEILSKLGGRSHLEIKQLSGGVRHQQGMRDRYLQGLERSYLYYDKIVDVFKEMNLPKRLSYLPHVESSFNYRAYSKVGAAGIWQFMRSTARLYRLKMNYIIDERRDPLKSARAAAKLLSDNYRKLESWPLALTAYNHGPVSIERAVKNVGTKEISEIIKKYDGRRFGFASKNFYATFMATVEISEDPGKYFSIISKGKPFTSKPLELEGALTIRQITKATGVKKEDIERHNLALRPTAFRSQLRIPKGFVLNFPPTSDEELEKYRVAMNSIKAEPKAVASGDTHVVSRGESLYVISQMYRVPLSDLIVINQVDRPSSILPGTVIKIPSSAERKKIAKISKIQKTEPETEVESSPKVEATQKPKVVATEVATVVETVETEKTPGFLDKMKGIFYSKKSQTQPETSAKELATPVETPVPVADMNAVHVEDYDLDPIKIRDGLYKVRVEVEETFGHFSLWANVPVQAIRTTNSLGRRRYIKAGQFLKIAMPETRLARFNQLRLEHHASIEEDFFESYKLTGMIEYTVKRGDTINDITRDLEIPLWLLRKFQKDNPRMELFVGQKIKIPQIVSLSE